MVTPSALISFRKDKQEAAQALSARINQAYQALLHPMLRIEYILDHNGHPLTETEQVTDMEFLAEVYEARERLDDAESAEDVQSLLTEITGKYALLLLFSYHLLICYFPF